MAKRSGLFETMRGGQIVFHYIRMTLQVVKKNVFFIVLMVAFLTLILAAKTTSKEDFKYGLIYTVSIVYVERFKAPDIKTEFKTVNDGKDIVATWGSIYKNKRMKYHYLSLISAVKRGFYLTIGGSFFGLFGWFWYLKNRGESESNDEFKRGGMLGTINEHEKMIAKVEKETGKKSVLSVANIKLPPTSRNTGMAFVGSPGSGKSVSINDLLFQLRGLGDKLFVIDPSGDYTRKHYREGIDIILSPTDARSVYWDIWSEGANSQSYHITASSLIREEKGGDSGDFFSRAARFVFEAVAGKLAYEEAAKGKPKSLDKLAKYLLRVDDETLVSMVRNTDAKSVLNEGSEKTAASIRATLSVYMQILAKLPQSGMPFSFKEWVNRDDDSCVFVPISSVDRAYFKPLLATWFEHLTLQVLSRNMAVRGRIIHAVCDELAQIDKVPSLLMFGAEARKYGGNLVLGYQSPAQLRSVYGDKDASALEDILSSYFIFRVSGSDGSEWASKLLMDQELVKTAESISMGAADVRDSVTLQKSDRVVKVVLASEIVSLPDLSFYARFGRGFKVVRGESVYKEYPDVAIPLIPRGDDYFNDLLSANESEISENESDSSSYEVKPSSDNTKNEKPIFKINEKDLDRIYSDQAVGNDYSDYQNYPEFGSDYDRNDDSYHSDDHHIPPEMTGSYSDSSGVESDEIKDESKIVSSKKKGKFGPMEVL